MSNSNDQLNHDETELEFSTNSGIAPGTKELNTKNQLNQKESNLSHELLETCLSYKEIHHCNINEDIISDHTRSDNLVTVSACSITYTMHFTTICHKNC